MLSWCLALQSDGECLGTTWQQYSDELVSLLVAWKSHGAVMGYRAAMRSTVQWWEVTWSTDIPGNPWGLIQRKPGFCMSPAGWALGVSGMSSQLQWGQPTLLPSSQPTEAGAQFWVLRCEGCSELGRRPVGEHRPATMAVRAPWGCGGMQTVGIHLVKGLCPSPPQPLQKELSTAWRKCCPGQLLGTAKWFITLTIFLGFLFSLFAFLIQAISFGEMWSVKGLWVYGQRAWVLKLLSMFKTFL